MDDLERTFRETYNYLLIMRLILKHLEISDIDKRLKLDFKFEDELLKLLELIEPKQLECKEGELKRKENENE